MPVGEEQNQKGEGTCQIVGVNPHELAAKCPAEGIQEAAPPAGCPLSPQKINILPVQVKNQNGVVAKGIYLHADVYEPHDEGGDDKAQPQVSAFAPCGCPKCSDVGTRRQKTGRTLLFLFASGFAPCAAAADRPLFEIAPLREKRYCSSETSAG